MVASDPAPFLAEMPDGGRVPLIDGFGRVITYLRLSLTDRCDLRCQYCMPADARFMAGDRRMALNEILGIAAVFADRGIRTIRLTGGEPLVRRDFDDIALGLGAMIGRSIDALTLTTNGSQLARRAGIIAKAGIRRINVSVDTLNASDYTRITRGGDLRRVIDGIAAVRARDVAVRINMVIMAGVNDRQLAAMLDWCADEGMDLALIETMPMGTGVTRLRSNHHLSAADFIARALGPSAITPIAHRTSGPARYVRIGDWPVRVGLITPISNNFCAQCNRIRISADGRVHGCLGHDDGIDLRAAWRSGGAPAIAPLIDRLMRSKAERHQFRIGRGLAEAGPARHMNATGG